MLRRFLTPLALSVVVSSAFGCKKSEPGDQPLPATPSAETICKRLETAKLAKGCKKASGVPNAFADSDMKGIAEVWSFDATFFEGRTFPGDVIRFNTTGAHAGSRVTLGLSNQFRVFSGPTAIHVQAKRKEGDPGYEKTVQLVQKAADGG